ncbi:uncharacterized protein BDZ99DRAFT_510929 [Mytilinidion resinicola]|uniref:DUF6594 domain-containing protein n=1 Tax=Mytilinidion resinicola TaxID=574789 RepID=A0A6A6YD43_9PEZI|nr:uncharacterized protein BDZ99DRAFT_510929 [Mytilinidion resinicola]KAF2806015.1 hypothetical protein BDZ99DRAFT_510929 [Mytilinidion resinicola]
MALPAPVTASLLSSLANPALVVPGTDPSPDPLEEKRKNKQTWKYQGYNEFAKWTASDDDFFIFRRFGKLNALTILWLQYRIGIIEEELEAIHEAIAGAALETGRKNSSFQADEKQEVRRVQLMSDLSHLLQKYNEYITTYSAVRARRRASARQIANVKNWATRKAVTEKEIRYLDHTGDLISISDRPHPVIHSFLNNHLTRKIPIFHKRRYEDTHVDSEYTSYASNNRLEAFSNSSIIFLGFSMLLGPMWWLNFVTNNTKRLGIITGFVLLSMVLMSLATVNRPFEVIAATAAYTAVLTVFMQLGAN